MLRYMCVCVLLALSCHGSAIPSKQKAPTLIQTNQIPFTTQEKLSKVSGTKESDGSCTCNLPPSLEEQFLQLKEVKQQINELSTKMSTMTVSQIKETLDDVIKRTDELKAHLDQQSLSSSVQQLTGIRDTVTSIKKTANHLNSSSDKQVAKMREELALLDDTISKMWSQNPHAKAEDLMERVKDLREQLAGDMGNTSYRGKSQKEMQEFCENHEIAAVGDSYVHSWYQEFRIGSWFMDPYADTEEKKAQIWHRSFEHSAWFFRYQNYADFIGRDNLEKPVYAKIHGTGFVGYKGSVYYHYTGKLYRHEVSTGEKTIVDFKVKDVKYLGTFVDTFVDLKIDEYGLWAIYVATDDNDDRISISKINPETLATEQTWQTNRHKISVCMSFMACGRLYTIDNCERRLPPEPHLTQYVYDTTTSKDYFLRYFLTAKFGHIWHAHYNPDPRFPLKLSSLADTERHNIFGWDNGHLVTFPITWKTK